MAKKSSKTFDVFVGNLPNDATEVYDNTRNMFKTFSRFV